MLLWMQPRVVWISGLQVHMDGSHWPSLQQRPPSLLLEAQVHSSLSLYFCLGLPQSRSWTLLDLAFVDFMRSAWAHLSSLSGWPHFSLACWLHHTAWCCWQMMANYQFKTGKILGMCYWVRHSYISNSNLAFLLQFLITKYQSFLKSSWN